MVNLPEVWHAPLASDDVPHTILKVQIGVANEHDIEKISEVDPSYDTERTKKLN